MAFDSFGDFVAALEKAGELVRISQPVATELEITELADREMKKPPGRLGREAFGVRLSSYLQFSSWPTGF